MINKSEKGALPKKQKADKKSKAPVASKATLVSKASVASKVPKKNKVLISESELLAKNIANLCLSKKAHDVVMIDLRQQEAFTDFLVLCTVDSDRQSKAVSDTIKEGLAGYGEKPKSIELSELTWVVQDYIDVVVHIFTEDRRKFYNLERLWGDGVFTHVKDEEPKAKVRKTDAEKPKKRVLKSNIATKRKSKTNREGLSS